MWAMVIAERLSGQSSCAKAGEYEGRWFDPASKKDDDPERKPERLWDAAAAQAIGPR